MKRLDSRLYISQAQEAARHIALNTPLRPSLGLVLGSGWAPLSKALDSSSTLDYADIPHFHKPHVKGHPGRLTIGLLSGRAVAVLSGRPHLYEGYEAAQVAFPVLVLKEMGISDLILTNAAGGLNPSYRPGDLMVITDHVNLPGFVGISPLVGMEGAFVDMTEAYDRKLIELAGSVALSLGKPAHEGVYVMVAGPAYETAAEGRLLRTLGADAVGMSTVPEVVAARWARMRVLAFSLITNMVLQPGAGLTHEDVLQTVEGQAPVLTALIEKLVQAWPQ